MWKLQPQTSNTDAIWLFCDGSTGMGGEIPPGIYPPAAPAAGANPSLRRLRRQFAGASGSAAAAVARDHEGRILDWAWEALSVATNNEAEYAGLLLGFQLAQRQRARKLICVLDSAVVIGQMEGRFAVNSKALRQWHWRACAAARAFPSIQYCLVPREWNRLADGLAYQASIPWQVLRGAMEDRCGQPAAVREGGKP